MASRASNVLAMMLGLAVRIDGCDWPHGVFCSHACPTLAATFSSLLTADGTRLKAFNAECLRRGVCKGREKLYMSLAHSDEDIAKTLEAFEGALAALPRSAPGTRA